jgi:hypothetical protein
MESSPNLWCERHDLSGKICSKGAETLTPLYSPSGNHQAVHANRIHAVLSVSGLQPGPLRCGAVAAAQGARRGVARGG